VLLMAVVLALERRRSSSPPGRAREAAGPARTAAGREREQIKLAVCRITQSDPLLVTHFVQRTYLLSCPLKAFYRAQIHIRIPPLRE
jgi:hypothetical protein